MNHSEHQGHVINQYKQQAKLQQQEESQAHVQRPGSAHSQKPQHDLDNVSEETLYERNSLDSRQRPESRASQHSTLVDFGNGHPNHGGGGHHRRNNAQEASSYQFQQAQFDEPGRSADDDMW